MEKSVIRAKHVILISNKKQRWKCFLIEHRSQLFKCYGAEIVFLTWYKMDIMLKAWIQIENMFFHLQSSVSWQFSRDLVKELKKIAGVLKTKWYKIIFHLHVEWACGKMSFVFSLESPPQGTSLYQWKYSSLENSEI